MGAINLENSLGENLAINPLADLWQRGTSFLGLNGVTYTADRFRYATDSGLIGDVVRHNSNNNLAGTYSIQIKPNAAVPGLSGTNFASIEQLIEGFNWRKAIGKNINIGFDVYSNKTGTYCFTVQNGAGNESFINEYQIENPNSWERKNIRMKVDSNVVFNVDNTTGARMLWLLAKEATFSNNDTTGEWLAGGFAGTSNQVNLWDSTDNEFRITNIAVTVGNDKKDFNELIRDFAVEEILSQRYFEKSYPHDTPPGSFVFNPGAVTAYEGNSGSQTVGTDVRFKVNKRTSNPVLTAYSPQTGVIGACNDRNGNVAETANFTQGGVGGFLFTTSNVNGNLTQTVVHYTADDEL